MSFWGRKSNKGAAATATTAPQPAAPTPTKLRLDYAVLSHICRRIDEATCEGLFRIPGSQKSVERGMDVLRRSPPFAHAELANLTALDLATLTNRYLRELDSALIPAEAAESLLEAFQLWRSEKTLGAIAESLRRIKPAVNRACLHRLIMTLNRVTTHTAVTKMTPSSLALVMAPSMFLVLDSGILGLSEHAGVLSVIIDQAETVFGGLTVLPVEFEEYYDFDEKDLYFVNEVTGETTWTRPNPPSDCGFIDIPPPPPQQQEEEEEEEEAEPPQTTADVVVVKAMTEETRWRAPSKAVMAEVHPNTKRLSGQFTMGSRATSNNNNKHLPSSSSSTTSNFESMKQTQHEGATAVSGSAPSAYEIPTEEDSQQEQPPQTTTATEEEGGGGEYDIPPPPIDDEVPAEEQIFQQEIDEEQQKQEQLGVQQVGDEDYIPPPPYTPQQPEVQQEQTEYEEQPQEQYEEGHQQQYQEEGGEQPEEQQQDGQYYEQPAQEQQETQDNQQYYEEEQQQQPPDGEEQEDVDKYEQIGAKPRRTAPAPPPPPSV